MCEGRWPRSYTHRGDIWHTSPFWQKMRGVATIPTGDVFVCGIRRGWHHSKPLQVRRYVTGKTEVVSTGCGGCGGGGVVVVVLESANKQPLLYGFGRVCSGIDL